MQDIIVIVILAVVIGAAVGYIWKQKKKGVHCIGCPDSTSCPHCSSGGCSCGSGQQSTVCSDCCEKK